MSENRTLSARKQDSYSLNFLQNALLNNNWSLYITSFAPDTLPVNKRPPKKLPKKFTRLGTKKSKTALSLRSVNAQVVKLVDTPS